MKYKIELTYNKDIDKSIRYDQNSKSFSKYTTFYIDTATPYEATTTDTTIAENVVAVDHTEDFNYIYNEVIKLFNRYDVYVDTNVLFLDESFNVKITLLLQFNVSTDLIFTNISDLFMLVVHDNTLVSIKPTMG